jgi:hypothetical protein
LDDAAVGGCACSAISATPATVPIVPAQRSRLGRFEGASTASATANSTLHWRTATT